MRTRAGGLWLGLCLSLACAACGETRALELFPKKAPPPPPPAETPTSTPSRPPAETTTTAPPAMPSDMPEMPPEPCGTLPQCPPDRAFCVAEGCVECLDETDCPADKSACLDNTCVECLTNEQCSMDKVCHVEAGRCTEACTVPEECKSRGRTACDVNRGLCVSCVRDEDCDAKHVCEPIQGSCVGCNSDVDCGDAGVCDRMRHECGAPPP